MKKIGRNHLCPCGSQKKYKRCHGGLSDNNRVTKNAEATTQLQFRIPNDGLPGLLDHVTIVPTSSDAGDPRNSKDGKGQPGEYELVWLLSRPGHALLPEYQITSADRIQGSSHLGVTRPAHPSVDPAHCRARFNVRFGDHECVFEGLPNDKGFLAKIIGRFPAESFADAYRTGTRVLAPTLSDLSAQLDIPLLIFQTDITEKRSDARRVMFTSAYRETPFAGVSERSLEPELRGYTSVYREALNSGSPTYQFLCFYKVVESLFERRGRQAKERKARGEDLRKPRERFPSSLEVLVPWLNALYPVRPHCWNPELLESLLLPQIAGSAFKTILDAHLRPLRDQIAHVLFKPTELKHSDEPGLFTDDPLSHEQVDKWLPVAKCMARKMLKNEFPKSFLVAIPDPSE